jgi:aminopeptidase-like protein
MENLSPGEILRLLYPFENGICNEDGKCISTYLRLLPFDIFRYPSGSELNGWILPTGWRAISAELTFKDGTTYNCLAASMLGVAYLSPCFEGTVTKEELIDHTCYRKDLPKAVVYDWTRIYRTSKQEWGICVPYEDLQSIPSGEIHVSIKTERYQSSMIVYSYLVKGKSSQEILFNAHNCHPYQANDDISGCAVLISLFQQLKAQRSLRYSYRLLIAPELFGPMFWLNSHPTISQNIKAALLLKSVANNNNLQAQLSFEGTSYLDRIINLLCLDGSSPISATHSFRTYHGNDETVFEAPGYEIPSVTLSRFPFEEYHTNLDQPSNISKSAINDSLSTLLDIVEILETDFNCAEIKDGLFCLSHPKYQLYKTSEELGISDAGKSVIAKRWNLLMNCLPRELKGRASIIDLALKYQLPFRDVRDYVNQWCHKNLCVKSTDSPLDNA